MADGVRCLLRSSHERHKKPTATACAHNETVTDDATLVARYPDAIQAEFAKSVLQGSGIDCFLDVPHTAAMFPHYVFAAGWVSLFVREGDLERAREVLAAADADTSDSA